MGLVIDFLERGGAMMLAGVMLLLIVAVKTLQPTNKKAKKENSESIGDVIAGRKEHRVIVMYSRSNLSPLDWEGFGLTVVKSNKNNRGSEVMKEPVDPSEEGENDGADAPLVERLEMSSESGSEAEEELTPEDEEQLQELIDFVEEHHRLEIDTNDGEEPLDISGLSMGTGM